MNVLISVIVPIYNSEKYLDRCINSIVNQTYKNLEILLINDGSTDKSLKICQEWAKKDKRIKIVNKKNGGVSSARNVGLNISAGQYISFIDSDDYLDKNCYSILINNKLDFDILVFNYYYDYSNDKNVGILNFKNMKFEYELFNKNSIQGYICNKLYKKSIINKIRFNEKIQICEDLLFNIEICTRNNGIKYKFFHEPLYYYFQNENSACNTKFKLDKTKFIAYSEIINNLENYDKYLCQTRKIQFIIDFNDYKLINQDKRCYDISKLSMIYRKQLYDISIKEKIKLFLSCHINILYYYIRLLKKNKIVKIII